MDQHSINRLDNIERAIWGDGRTEPRGGLINEATRHSERLAALEQAQAETARKLDRLIELTEQIAVDSARGRRAFARLESLRRNGWSIALMALAVLVVLYMATLPITLSDWRHAVGLAPGEVLGLLAAVAVGLMLLSLATRRWENGNGHGADEGGRDG